MIKATKPVMPSYEDYVKEIKSIWNHGQMTNNGPKVQELRQMILDYTNGIEAELYVNGHMALLLGIKAMKFPKGGEVLTSPFTFISTTNAIAQSDLVPIFCDVDEHYNIDIESIRRNITSKTCAIITPHIFGIPNHVDEINQIAKEYGLKVIYDGAQAFGTKILDKHIGLYGDATMFSFHAIKVYNSIEGGCLMYADPQLKKRLEILRNFGITYGETNDVIADGYNGKMDEFRAAMGILNLPELEHEIERRTEIAGWYQEALKEISGIVPYAFANPSVRYNYAYFPVIVDAGTFGITRDELWKCLREDYGIETRKLYDTLTCDNTFYKDKGYRTDVAYARELTKKCLDLPMYGTLEKVDVLEIAEAIKKLHHTEGI